MVVSRTPIEGGRFSIVYRCETPNCNTEFTRIATYRANSKYCDCCAKNRRRMHDARYKSEHRDISRSYVRMSAQDTADVLNLTPQGIKILRKLLPKLDEVGASDAESLLSQTSITLTVKTEDVLRYHQALFRLEDGEELPLHLCPVLKAFRRAFGESAYCDHHQFWIQMLGFTAYEVPEELRCYMKFLDAGLCTEGMTFRIDLKESAKAEEWAHIEDPECKPIDARTVEELTKRALEKLAELLKPVLNGAAEAQRDETSWAIRSNKVFGAYGETGPGATGGQFRGMPYLARNPSSLGV